MYVFKNFNIILLIIVVKMISINCKGNYFMNLIFFLNIYQKFSKIDKGK